MIKRKIVDIEDLSICRPGIYNPIFKYKDNQGLTKTYHSTMQIRPNPLNVKDRYVIYFDESLNQVCEAKHIWIRGCIIALIIFIFTPLILNFALLASMYLSENGYKQDWWTQPCIFLVSTIFAIIPLIRCICITDYQPPKQKVKHIVIPNAKIIEYNMYRSSTDDGKTEEYYKPVVTYEYEGERYVTELNESLDNMKECETITVAINGNTHTIHWKKSKKQLEKEAKQRNAALICFGILFALLFLLQS